MANKSSASSGGALPFFIGFIAMLFVGWWVFPQALFSAMEQPIRFSHKVHAEDQGMACEDCHFFNDDGSYNGIPTTAQCAECHSDVLGSDPAEKTFVEEYVAKEKEVPWVIYQHQPDNVYFSHAAHKKQECASCHPDMAKNDTPPVVYVNKLTGYTQLDHKMLNDTGTMKMHRCERCHALNGQSNACYVCHR